LLQAMIFKRSSSRFANGSGSVHCGSGTVALEAPLQMHLETWILLELCNYGSLQVRARSCIL